MDISIIKEMPKGRLPVETFVKSNEQITDVLEMMLEELNNKHQIYVIAPLIEDSENSDLTSVNELRDKMNLAFGKKYKIDLLHGKIGNNQKDEIQKLNEVNISLRKENEKMKSQIKNTETNKAQNELFLNQFL